MVVHCALLYRSICQWLLNSWAWVKAKLAFCRIYSNFFKDSLKRDARPSFFRISKKVLNKQPLLVISKKVSSKSNLCLESKIANFSYYIPLPIKDFQGLYSKSKSNGSWSFFDLWQKKKEQAINWFLCHLSLLEKRRP